MNKLFASTKMGDYMMRSDEEFTSYKHLQLQKLTKKFKTLNVSLAVISKKYDTIGQFRCYIKFQKKIYFKNGKLFERKLEGKKIRMKF